MTCLCVRQGVSSGSENRPILGQITPNCYLLGGGNDLPTASLGKSIAKKQGKPLLNREQRVKWEIPVEMLLRPIAGIGSRLNISHPLVAGAPLGPIHRWATVCQNSRRPPPEGPASLSVLPGRCLQQEPAVEDVFSECPLRR